MPTLIEQLLLDDPSQVVERGYFFENSSEGIGIITDTSDKYIKYEVLSKLLKSEPFVKALNRNTASSKEFKEFKYQNKELVIDSFCYQINFKVDFTLNYFENISKIFLKIYPSLRNNTLPIDEEVRLGDVLDIGVTGYLYYESNERVFHKEKLSFRTRAAAQISYLLDLYKNGQSIRITNIFKYNNDYNGMFSLFKKEIAEKLAQLM